MEGLIETIEGSLPAALVAPIVATLRGEDPVAKQRVMDTLKTMLAKQRLDATPAGTGTFLRLTDWALSLVLEFLTPRELGVAAVANRRMRRLCSSGGFWFPHLKAMLPVEAHPLLVPKIVPNPAAFYGAKHHSPVEATRLLKLLSVTRRFSLPPSDPEFARVYAHVYLSRKSMGPESRTSLMLTSKNVSIGAGGRVTMAFPPGGYRVVVFYGQQGIMSDIDLEIVTRTGAHPLCPHPVHLVPGGRAKGANEFNCRAPPFMGKLTTLSRSGVEEVGRLLRHDKDAFKGATNVYRSSHKVARHGDSGKYSRSVPTMMQGNSLDATGELVRLKAIVDIETLYKAANRPMEEEDPGAGAGAAMPPPHMPPHGMVPVGLNNFNPLGGLQGLGLMGFPGAATPTTAAAERAAAERGIAESRETVLDAILERPPELTPEEKRAALTRIAQLVSEAPAEAREEVMRAVQTVASRGGDVRAQLATVETAIALSKARK